ncbi:FecR domain-containing protein [Stakelama sp. CBK3Z-3]|uniref:FecR domain-containing protein n=1 Tax=Stakelama flava TaxID=2860338 RepID=A0ABS6XPT6_9SPHN|nr:FecR domain-containing protein [Stakelama flava]MBW4332227.1 FecR domain-containing protein [Stakelama flava]
MASPDFSPDDAVRAEAADWFARMRGPDAERHRTAFDAWYRADGAHAAAYDRMELRWNQSGLVGHTPSGQTRAGLPEAPLRAFPSRALALAASILAILVLGALLLSARNARPGKSQSVQIAHAETLESPRGSIRRVTLADGSTVTLDSDSRIVVAFIPGARRLRLVAGRARFDVAHDADRPFIVSAGGGEVVATGTLFDVSLISGRPRVRLIEGSVEVRRPGPGDAADAALPPAIRLAPGQMAAVDAPAPLARAPAAGERWVSGTLSFEDAPLDAVLAQANRYTERQVRLGDPSLGALRFTGGFRAGHSDKLARALAVGFGLRIDRAANGDPVLVRP